MNTSRLRVRVLLTGAALPALALTAAGFGAAPASAQEVDCPDENLDGICDAPILLETQADGSEPGLNSIVVTGSRIRRDNFSSGEPLTVVTKDETTLAGFSNTTDALQSNQITAGSEQINNYYSGFVTDGGTGANTLGLAQPGSGTHARSAERPPFGPGRNARLGPGR